MQVGGMAFLKVQEHKIFFFSKGWSIHLQFLGGWILGRCGSFGCTASTVNSHRDSAKLRSAWGEKDSTLAMIYSKHI